MSDDGCECKYCVADRKLTERDHVADALKLAWPLIEGNWKSVCPTCSHPGQCERCWYAMLDAERKRAESMHTDGGKD